MGNPFWSPSAKPLPNLSHLSSPWDSCSSVLHVPFVFHLGEFPYLYLPSSFDSVFYGQGMLEGLCINVCGGDRTEFNQARARWEVLVQRARAWNALNPRALGKLPVRAGGNVSRQ